MMKTVAQGLWDWFSARAHTAHAKAWLCVLSFTEASCFIVPPEILMIPMLAADGRRWVWIATLTTIAAVAGAIFGYVLGYFFFDTIGEQIISFYELEDDFSNVAELFENNAFWVMFTAAFTPIPFKVAVLTAGFFNINFFAFLMASAVGRFLRYLGVAYLAKRFGPKLAELVLNYANIATAIFVILAALVFLVLK